jgi:hypothetical protein
MFDSWNQSRRAAVGRALVALAIATACLAAVAYAASKPHSGVRPGAVGVAGRAAPVPDPRSAAARPPRPRIVRHPGQTTLSTRVAFRYVDSRDEVSFQCRLDSVGWKHCGTRAAYRGLAVGPHRFLVRAEAKSGRRSRPARFDWVQGEPKRFEITADLSGLSRLYPGAPPQLLPLVLTNPNSAPISVTGLRASVAGDSAACPSAANLELIQATASEAKPVKVPAGGSVRLPASGISPPAIALRDLPVNQDACQGAEFSLAFSGDARG